MANSIDSVSLETIRKAAEDLNEVLVKLDKAHAAIAALEWRIAPTDERQLTMHRIADDYVNSAKTQIMALMEELESAEQSSPRSGRVRNLAG